MTSTSASQRQLSRGIYVPVVTPFNGNEDLDLEALGKHVVRLGKADVGLVLLGTTAEAIHLTPAERATIISSSRKSLDAAGLGHIPIIAGTGTGSLRETVQLSHDAKKAGADAVIVIAPSFFGGKLKDDRAALKEFWWEAAEKSPLPLMIYNFPAVTGGVDLNSDLLEELAQHPNIMGAKLTCAQIGKGHRLATSTAHASHPQRQFMVLSGFSDIMFPAMMAGLQGSITGLGNLTPRLVAKLYDVTVSAMTKKDWAQLDEARKLSDVVSRADWACTKAGIGGSKWGVAEWWPETGMNVRVRRPLTEVSDAVKAMMTKELQEAIAIEKQLEKEAK